MSTELRTAEAMAQTAELKCLVSSDSSGCREGGRRAVPHSSFGNRSQNLTHEPFRVLQNLFAKYPEKERGVGEPQLLPRRGVQAGPRRGAAAPVSPPLPRCPRALGAGRGASAVTGPRREGGGARRAGRRGPAGLAPAAAGRRAGLLS